MISDDIWVAIFEAEDACGEGAEEYALARASAARSGGDQDLAGLWDQAAGELHILHRINRTWARPREQPFSGV